MGEGAVLRGVVQSEVMKEQSREVVALKTAYAIHVPAPERIFQYFRTRTAIPLSTTTRVGFKFIIHHRKEK